MFQLAEIQKGHITLKKQIDSALLASNMAEKHAFRVAVHVPIGQCCVQFTRRVSVSPSVIPTTLPESVSADTGTLLVQ